MKRLPLILSALALLVALASPVTAKVVNVTNPMAADLDGGGHNITNVANYQTGSGATFAGQGVFLSDISIADAVPVTTMIVSVNAGTADPSVSPGLDRNAGSLYSQQTGGPLGTGALWFKTGGCPACWAKVAG